MHMPSREAIDVCYKIREFYLKKHDGDKQKATEDIQKSEFRDVDIVNGNVCIKTCRPGWLIGKRGQNIEALTKFLGMDIKIIEENDINCFIIPPEDDKWEYEEELRIQEEAYKRFGETLCDEYNS